jgi:PAS domain S-box-containing protein
MRYRLFGSGTQLFASSSDFASQQYAGHHVRKLCLLWALRAFVISLLTVSASLSTAAQVKPVRRVLVFNDFGSVSSPGIAEMDREIFDGLQKSPYQVEFYNENLEVTLFSDEAFQRQAREWYIRKYADRRPDVIITVGPASLRFMQEMHEGAFKDTPVVFCGIMEIPAGVYNSRFTGAWSGVQIEKTMESALRLRPGTRHVVVVGGVGSLDREEEAIVRENLRGYESRFDFTYLTDFSMPDLLEQLKVLPSDTIVLHTAITQDAAGNRFIDATQAVPLVAGAARAPVFVLDDVDLNNGAVGGDLLSWAATARDAAESALRILNGEKPQDIPIVRSGNVYMFDWPALQRWGLKESNLPPGSLVLNKPSSFWKLYWRYVVAGVFLLLAQALIIVGLLWQQRLRREAQSRLVAETEKLQAREELLKIFVKHVPAAVAMLDRDMRYIQVSDRWCSDYGVDSSQVVGRSHYDIFPDLPRHWKEVHSRGLAGETIRADEDPWYRESGTTWLRWEIRPWQSRSDGAPGGILIFTEDITRRKQMEEALSTVSQKLIEAHEEERTRIARELHDDIHQQVALLAVNLDGLQQDPRASAAGLQQEIGKRVEQVQNLGADVQALSHRLHSSKLDYLGLVSAAAGLCKELSNRQGIEIEFHADNVPRNLPKDVSLCLFRALQEALQNAIKHSGSGQVQVSLRGGEIQVEMMVRDSGIGFDPEEAMKGSGLGLVSMTERLKLVNGSLSIDSQLERGTTIQARVPLTPKAKSAGAVG